VNRLHDITYPEYRREEHSRSWTTLAIPYKLACHWHVFGRKTLLRRDIRYSGDTTVVKYWAHHPDSEYRVEVGLSVESVDLRIKLAPFEVCQSDGKLERRLQNSALYVRHQTEID
jgi:hypothetical protein